MCFPRNDVTSFCSDVEISVFSTGINTSRILASINPVRRPTIIISINRIIAISIAFRFSRSPTSGWASATTLSTSSTTLKTQFKSMRQPVTGPSLVPYQYHRHIFPFADGPLQTFSTFSPSSFLFPWASAIVSTTSSFMISIALSLVREFSIFCFFS